MDVIEILIRLLFILFVGIMTPVASTIETGPVVEVSPLPGDVSTIPFDPQFAPEETVQRVPTVIESVDARLLESFPVQIHLQVSGYQPDGCDV